MELLIPGFAVFLITTIVIVILTIRMDRMYDRDYMEMKKTLKWLIQIEEEIQELKNSQLQQQTQPVENQ